MIAHIRCATHGLVSLENTHPFSREMWGINWCFAHNGDVADFSHQRAGHHVVLGCDRNKMTPNTTPTTTTTALATQEESKGENDYNLSYHAVGDTDSEAIFCAILNALKARFQQLPSLSELHATLQELCHEIVAPHHHQTIICNFLLACGEYTLFAYSYPGQRPGSDVWNGLYYITREPPFSTARLVDDEDYSIDFSLCSTAADRISIIATKPLTDEAGWKEMGKGELLMFDKGVAYSTSSELDAVEAEGRGLESKCLEKKKAHAATTTASS